MKKFFAILLAVCLVAALTVTAMAADEETPSITISGAADGETYTAYKILSATYDGTLGSDTAIAYYYTGAATDALYLALTANGFEFQSFVDGVAYLKYDCEPTEANIIALAAAINANTAMLSACTTASATAASGSATISLTEKGYYFVDTTLGSLCSIGTAGAVTIYEKNSAPSLKKEVQEDSTEAWGSSATAAKDDTVHYRLTVNTGTNSNAPGTPAPNGVDADYTIEDTIPTGMTVDDTTVASTTSNVIKSATLDGQKLTIVLDGTVIAGLGQNADIVITYDATFTSAAVANTEYTNSAILKYQNQTTDAATATVKMFEFTISKTNEEEAALEGVTFTVQRAADSKYLQADGTWGDTAAELATNEDGEIVVTGIDEDTYTITEVNPLPGYTKLDAPLTVTVANTGTASGTGVADNVLTVVNYSGTVLPSTGGMGVYVFYILGGVLVAAACVLLVVRKRMSHEG